MSKTQYDKKTEILWISSDADGDTLVDERPWVLLLKEGAFEGNTLKGINIVFSDPEGAEYNQHPLAFSKIGTFVGSLDDAKPYDGDPVSFDAKEDFGV